MYLVRGVIAGALIGCVIMAFCPVSALLGIAGASVGGAIGAVLDAAIAKRRKCQTG